MNTRKQLVAAYELVRDRDDWCRDEFAYDSNNLPCDPESDDARVFCAEGALMHVGAEPEAWGACTAAAWATHRMRSVSALNDLLGHGAVLDMFERAILASGGRA